MIVENQRHTTDIVAAYVRHNSVATDQISGLINAVHSTLNGLGNVVVEGPPRVPAVSVRRSVRPDHIICIECGYKGQMLKKHLQSRHGLSVAEYRSRWNLASDYPMTGPNYSERRSQLAKSIPLDRVPARCWNRRAGRCRLIVATAGRAHRDTSTIRSSGISARPQIGSLGACCTISVRGRRMPRPRKRRSTRAISRSDTWL